MGVTGASSRAPLPPVELAARVGPGPGADPLQAYEREGADVRARIEALLPSDWTFDGKRVLDFGCGSARVLRHFLPDAERGDFWGCDVDGPSIAWIAANLSPPLHCFRNELAPPLAVADGSFDLVYATSVFTHIGEPWSAWVAEMQRILSPGGILIASFLGEGVWEAMVGEPYDEDQIGMVVRGHWKGPDSAVFHSEWWLREHWGRAFEVTAVARPPRDANGVPQVTHSYVALRRRDATVCAAELERCDPAEPRELAALQTSVRLLRRELELVAAGAQDVSRWAALRRALLASPAGPAARALRRRVRALGL